MATVCDSAVTLSLVLISPVMAHAHLDACPSQPHESTTEQPNRCLKCRFDHVPLVRLPIALRITSGLLGLAPKALPLAFPSPLFQAPLLCCTELLPDAQHKQCFFPLSLRTHGCPCLECPCHASSASLSGHSFSQQNLLSTYYVSDTVLGPGANNT